MKWPTVSAFVVLAVVSALSAFAGDVKVVEAEGRAVVGDYITPAEAKAIALNNAKREALETAVGTAMHGSTVIYNSELINDLIVTATKGLIVRQDILEDGCATEDGQYVCSVRIKAHVRPLNLERRGNFRITGASVGRPGGGAAVRNLVFQNNDEIQIRVKANKDSYVNVFSVDQNGNVIKLYPGEYFKPELLSADKEFVFPEEKERAMGLALRVSTPGEAKKAVESVLIVATSEKVGLLAGESADGPTITDLMRELSELDPSVWTEKAIGYEVRR
jgi:hypothetical protein